MADVEKVDAATNEVKALEKVESDVKSPAKVSEEVPESTGDKPKEDKSETNGTSDDKPTATGDALNTEPPTDLEKKIIRQIEQRRMADVDKVDAATSEVKALEKVESDVKSPAKDSEEVPESTDDKPKEDKSETNGTSDDKPTATGDAPNTEPPTDLEKKIIRQIEYYFGDYNITRDKFLHGEIRKDDGWVTLETMVKFNRLAVLSTDIDALATAVSKSTADVVHVSADRLKIRRNPMNPVEEMNKQKREDMLARSIYAKGFGADATLDELQAYFDGHGTVDMIFMRRYKVEKIRKEDTTYVFKGSVFVQFAKVEEAQKFLAVEKLKYKDTDLITMTKESYMLKKTEEYNEVKEKQKENKAVKNLERKKVQEERKEHEDSKISNKMTKKAVLFVKNIPKETKMEVLKEFWRGHGNVAYVEYETGETEAYVRFYCENNAPEALDAAQKASDGKVVFAGKDLEVTLLEGDSEMQYWKRRFGGTNNRKRKMGGGHRGGGRGGSSRGGFSKRKRFDD